jgi:hypothetical protein
MPRWKPLGKPIIKVPLLPLREAGWDEQKFSNFCDCLVAAAMTVGELEVKDESGIIILFAADRMEYGLGTYIPVEIDVPKNRCLDKNMRSVLSRHVGETVQEFLPDAYVQCQVYVFDETDGFWSSDMKRVT